MKDICLSQAIHIMFAEISATDVLNAISGKTYSNHRGKALENVAIPEEIFCRKCVKVYPWLSFADAQEMYRAALARIKAQESSSHSAFSLLQIVAREFLREDGSVLVCQHESFITWRETVHTIGQSALICAYWAWKDKGDSTLSRRCDFPPYARTDDLRLQQILTKGMAENHFHLKGSAPVFLLSWICLMNNIENRKREFGSQLLKNRFFQYHDNINLHCKVLQAAYIRFYLWRKYIYVISHRKSGYIFSQSKTNEDDLKKIKRFIDNPLSFATIMQRKISIHRKRYRDDRLDYSGSPHYSQSPYSPIEGEHRFLYVILRELYSGNLYYIDQILFYAYLLISVELRKELVQVNNAVGFSNFSDYQNRKEIFLESYGEYEDALVRMAHASVLDNPSVQCLEARITPKNTSAKLYSHHKKLEKLVIEGSNNYCKGQQMVRGIPFFYASLPNPKGACWHFDFQKNSCRRNEGPCPASLAKVSYVHHFIKSPERYIDWNRSSEKLKAARQCRHFFHIRRAIEQPAGALIGWRNSGARQAGRVYGIDACNFEIGCRPEVFAPTFRRLRNHIPSPLFRRLYPWSPPSLRVTYHVGEDFLDVVDGLRAIDEAVHFFELRHGDRLGHVIALGINAPNWYAFKKGKVFLPKQDLLDNIAWFYCRLLRHGLCDIELEHRLQAEYSKLYLEIFEDTPVPISIYFEAWKLRGNHPKNFIKRECPSILANKFKLTRFRHEIQNATDRKSFINSQAVYSLVHRYHYDPDVRARGAMSKEFHICTLYIKAVSALQQIMRIFIARKGIGIETNPSSNFLIGTFRNYQESPLVTFYDRGLRDAPESELLFVSINTDDQGIFDTTLENEFALMACAMTTVEDKHGKRIYSPDHVYRWIDNIRSMGLEQSFKLLYQKLGNEL